MKEQNFVTFRDRFFTDFYLSFCSWTSGNKSQAYGPSASCFTLYLILSGNGTITSSSSNQIAAGQWMLIPPSVSADCRPAAGQPWELIRIGFSGIRAGKILTLMGLDTFLTPFHCKNTDHVRLLAEQLLTDDPSLKQILLRQSIACQILALLTENRALWPEGRHPALSSYVSLATEYVSRHYKAPLSVSQIADHLGITRNYLFTLFKGELHCSPRQYILTFRLRRACELLKHTEYSVEDIALSCGYQDPAAFSKAFRRHYGQTPGKYRKDPLTAFPLSSPPS